MSIGAFARASRLSARALRLYDTSGLLAPARVDPDTGYRWYEPAQLEVPARHAYTSLPFEAISDWLTDHGATAGGFPEQIILARPRDAADDDVVHQITVPIT